MNFLHSGFLVAGVAAATIPVLIHLLLRRRRAPVEWAAMAQLEEAIRRTSKRLRLEQLLLLALRVLAILLASAALAVPFFGRSTTTSAQRRLIVLVLDDGVSSGLRVGVETELEQSASLGVASLQTLSAGDRVALIHASRPARIEILPTQDHASVITALERATANASATDFDGVFTLVGQLAIEADTQLEVEVLSAFRRGSLSEGSVLAPLPTRDQAPVVVRLTPSALVAAANISVVSIEPRVEMDGGSVLALVRLARSGEVLASESTRVWLDGESVHASPARLVRWEAGQSEATIELAAPFNETTAQRGLAALTAHISTDLLTADDARTAMYEARRSVRVGIAGRRGTVAMANIETLPASVWAARALAPSTSSRDIHIVEIDPAAIDARTLLGLDALIVARPTLLAESGWQALRQFVEEGGVLLVFPDGETEAQTWTVSMTNALRLPWSFASDAPTLREPQRAAANQPSQKTGHAIFRSIEAELPALLAPLEFYRFLNTTSAPEEDVSLRLENGAPLFLSTRPDGAALGFVALLTVSPELLWSNLPVKPAIVPLLQESLRSGLQSAGGVQSGTVGERVLLSGEYGGVLESADGKSLRVREDGWTVDPFPTTGVWRGGDKRSTALAVNVNTKATRLTPVLQSEILQYFSPVGVASTTFASASTERHTEHLAQTDSIALGCLVALAIILLCESILSRAFSHAGERRAARVGVNVDIGLRGLGARTGLRATRDASPAPTHTKTQDAKAVT